MELNLIRSYFPNGTNSDLLLNGQRVCWTIELPWKNNQHEISCIPEGRYELNRRYTQKFGHHLILLNVPDRSMICIHAANNALKEIKGCICTVSKITGEGTGDYARSALVKVISLVYPAFDKEKVFLTIQSVKHE